MNIVLPGNPAIDLASSTSDIIFSVSPIVTLLLGIIFAFFIIDSIILMLVIKYEK